MIRFFAALVLFPVVAFAAQAPDSLVVTGPNNQQVPTCNLLVTAPGSAQSTLCASFLPSNQLVDVKRFGAKGDGQIASPVITLSGNTLLTVAPTFTQGDIGKAIVVAGGGVGPTSGPPVTITTATPGSGYTSVPTCAITDAGGGGASATCAALMVAQNVTLTTGGATCTNGTQTFLVSISTAGTNNGTPAQVTGTVAGGVLTGTLTITAPGLFTGIGGTTSVNIYGANCATPPTVSIDFGVGATQVTNWGNSLYSTTQTTAALSGGSPGTAATLGAVTIGAPIQPLVTTISNYTSPTQVTLAAAATTAINGVATQILWATNDGPAFQKAINAGQGIWIPAGFYWIGSALDPGRGPMSIRGEGINNTILAWDNGSSAVQNVGNWTQMFLNTAGSSTTPTGYIQMEDFQIRGLLDFGRFNFGAAALELNNYYELKLSRMKFLNIPFMAMQPESIKVYSVRDSVFENVLRDQARCRSCFDKTVIGNTFRHSGDDSVAFHQANYITAAGAIGEAAVVTGNTFEDTQGIDIIGARDIIVTGNICRRMKGRCLTITGSANEGQNQLYSINISNNQALDTLGASTPYQPGGGVFNLSFAGAGAPTGITNFVPGANNYPTTYFGKPWDYMSTVAVGSVGFAPAVRGINIHDNLVMRTLPSTISYSLWGYGQQLYAAGWISGPATDVTMLTTAGAAISANAPGTIIHHNDFMDTLYGITVNDTITVPTEATISITFNHFYNNYGGGINGFGTGTMGNVDIIGNDVDVDPYLSSPGRSGNHGGWSNAYASSKCINWGYTGPLTLAYNTFSDCYSIPTNTGWKIAKNTIKGQPSVSSTGQPTAWQSDAYGIGVYPAMAGDNFYIGYVATDPSAAPPANLGLGLSAHPVASAAAPTSGYHVINDMIWSTAPGTCTCQGWLALTTGSAWTSGTDYKVVPIQ